MRFRVVGHDSCFAISANFDLMRWSMAGKREEIDTGSDKRYVRRDEQGQFDESDDQGRSLSQDQRREAETDSGKGQGDRGDRKDKS
jgi:hypothetical protein